jgi:hypothetical protein
MLNGYDAMRTLALGAIGTAEAPPGSNAGPALSRLLYPTNWTDGLEWCGFFVERIWLAGMPIKAGDPSPWWLDGGSAHLTLAKAKQLGKVLSGPAMGCMALLLDGSGKPFHYAWVMTVAPEGKSVLTVEGNTNTDGSANGEFVWMHTRPTASCVFIAP